MSNIRSNIGQRDGNRMAELEARIRGFETLLRQTPSRYTCPSPQSVIIAGAKTSHGFSVMDAVFNEAGTWKLANKDSPISGGIGLVTSVPTSGTFSVLVWGRHAFPGATLTVDAVYGLNDTDGDWEANGTPALFAAESATEVVIVSAAAASGGAPFEVYDTAATPKLVGTLKLGTSEIAGVLQLFKNNVGSAAYPLIDIDLENATAPTGGWAEAKKLYIREIDICEVGVMKKMMVLGSAPY